MHRQVVSEFLGRQNMNVNHVFSKKTKTLQSLCLTYFPAVLLSASLALEMSSHGGFLCLGKAA